MVRNALPLLVAAALGVQGVRVRRKGKTETRPKFIAGVPLLNYQQAYGGYGAQTATTAEEHWVVAVKKTMTDEHIKSLCSLAKCEKTGHPSKGGVPFFQIHGTEEDLKDVIKAADGQVEFVEPDGVVSNIPDIDEVSTTSLSWGLDRVGASQRASQGLGVHVYVLDTGVRTNHKDFGGRAIPTLELETGDAVECAPTDSLCAKDNRGHGTHCSGTIAGATFGIAPQANIHAVKVLANNGEGSWSWTYTALDWIAMNGKSPAIASMSLGGSGTQMMMEGAVEAAVDSGVVVIVAGGNSNADACNFSPAFVPKAITVGSTDSADKRSSFSNYGQCTDIWAPGSKIVSAGVASDTSDSTKSGTSMACPHVSGGAALVLAANPSWSPAQVLAKLLATAEMQAISDLKAGDTNMLLWVGQGPAPVPAPTPPPPPPPSCPDFAEEPVPDGDMDCACKWGTFCARNNSIVANCPTSGDEGGWNGKYFWHTCGDCFCIPRV